MSLHASTFSDNKSKVIISTVRSLYIYFHKREFFFYLLPASSSDGPIVLVSVYSLLITYPAWQNQLGREGDGFLTKKG